jgi:hypothetical protein
MIAGCLGVVVNVVEACAFDRPSQWGAWFAWLSGLAESMMNDWAALG